MDVQEEYPLQDVSVSQPEANPIYQILTEEIESDYNNNSNYLMNNKRDGAQLQLYVQLPIKSSHQCVPCSQHSIRIWRIGKASTKAFMR